MQRRYRRFDSVLHCGIGVDWLARAKIFMQTSDVQSDDTEFGSWLADNKIDKIGLCNLSTPVDPGTPLPVSVAPAFTLLGPTASSRTNMIQDSVVALIPEHAVRDVLPAIHRAGLGHLARVIRSGRNPVLDQLQRAGVPVSQAPAGIEECDAILLVTAAARSQMAASLLLQSGANQVWTVSGIGVWIVAEDVLLTKPNVHLLPPHPAQHVPGLTGRHTSRLHPSTASSDQVD